MQADEQITDPNFIFVLIGILAIIGGFIEGLTDYFKNRGDRR